MSPKFVGRVGEHKWAHLMPAAPPPKTTATFTYTLHPAEESLIAAHREVGISLALYQASILLHALREHMVHELPDYDYRNPPQWSRSDHDRCWDARMDHDLVRSLCGVLWPFAWQSHETPPAWLTVISIELASRALGVALPHDWPERTDPRP